MLRHERPDHRQTPCAVANAALRLAALTRPHAAAPSSSDCIDMSKSGFLTAKAIGNRIKAKGLQKLRWSQQQWTGDANAPVDAPAVAAAAAAADCHASNSIGEARGAQSPESLQWILTSCFTSLLVLWCECIAGIVRCARSSAEMRTDSRSDTAQRSAGRGQRARDESQGKEEGERDTLPMESDTPILAVATGPPLLVRWWCSVTV